MAGKIQLIVDVKTARAITALMALPKKADEAGAKMKKNLNKHGEGMASDMVKNIGTMLASLAGIAVIGQQIKSAFQLAKDEANAAADAIAKTYDASNTMLESAGGSTADFQKHKATARWIAEEYGLTVEGGTAPNLKLAESIRHGAYVAGVDPKKWGKLGMGFGEGTEQLIYNTRKIHDALGEGTMEETLAALIQAAKPAAGVDASQLAAGIVAQSGTAAAQNWTLDEFLARGAALTFSTKSPEQAGTTLRAALKQQREGLIGARTTGRFTAMAPLGPFGGIGPYGGNFFIPEYELAGGEELDTALREMSKHEQQAGFGSELRANLYLNAIIRGKAGKGRVDEFAAAIKKERGKGFAAADEYMRPLFEDPEMAIELEGRKQLIGRDEARRERYGIPEKRRDAIRDKIMKEKDQARDPGYSKYRASAEMAFYDFFNLDPETIEVVGRTSAAETFGAAGDLAFSTDAIYNKLQQRESRYRAAYYREHGGYEETPQGFFRRGGEGFKEGKALDDRAIKVLEKINKTLERSEKQLQRIETGLGS